MKIQNHQKRQIINVEPIVCEAEHPIDFENRPKKSLILKVGQF